MRNDGRELGSLREIKFIKDFTKNPEGSCLVNFGNTMVLCTATIEDRVPVFLRGTGQGWITAEYSMLPRATSQRTDREASKGRLSGRTQEIQRLIGRSLRAALDLNKLPGMQIKIDCDVLQADGGTRTASICGGFVALKLAVQNAVQNGMISENPIINSVSAISCGIVNGEILVDLNYLEDSSAQVDANFVFNGEGKIIEIQSSAEKNAFEEEEFFKMFQMAKEACKKIVELQYSV